MKSGVAAFVVACLQLSDRLAVTPGVVLVITAGEETGCTGAAALAQGFKNLPKVGAFVVAEPTGNRPMVGHKGALWLEAVTKGLTAHGSMPEKGVNAVYKAARAVTALQDFDFNVARHDVLGGPTLNVGTITGGLNINSVPDRAAIGIDIRTIPGQNHAGIREQLASYLGTDVALGTRLDAQSVWTNPHDAWIAKVVRTAREIAGVGGEIGAAPYFTDASILTPAMGTPPTAIIGPGELELAHQTDEYCFVSRIEQATEIYTALIRDWCAL
jgi:succinyl-diaminopimelate desuccinylase